MRQTIVDRVGWIGFDRPQASNAAQPAMMQSLCAAIDSFVNDPEIRAIVLKGEGRHFLAGGDLDWLAEVAAGTGTDAAHEIYHWFQGATRRLASCPKPTIAAITGAAMTVGAEIALACDIRLVDRSAFFAESWLELGLVTPLGGAVWLADIIGLGRAKEMLLECRRIGAEEAVAIGLASEMFETPDVLYARAQDRAVTMAARPAAAFARMKRLIHDGRVASLQDMWAAGIAAQGELLGSEDFRAALKARQVATPQRPGGGR